jgi:hypothetical protein
MQTLITYSALSNLPVANRGGSAFPGSNDVERYQPLGGDDEMGANGDGGVKTEV